MSARSSTVKKQRRERPGRREDFEGQSEDERGGLALGGAAAPQPGAPDWAAIADRLERAPDLAALRRGWTRALGELASHAARAGIADAADVGGAAGLRLWALARAAVRSGARRHGNREHFEPLYVMRDEARTAASASATREARSRIDAAELTFDLAARGTRSIEWPTRGASGTPWRVLFTGFDPFGSRRPPRAPRGADWNPSGEAVMRLDRTELGVGRDTIAIAGVVYPVSYEQFDRGIVEEVVRAQAHAVDAIITVSMDAGIGRDQPSRIERFAVGVHHRSTLAVHRTRTERASPAEERIPMAGGAADAAPILDVDARNPHGGARGAGSVHEIARAAGVSEGVDLHLRFRSGNPRILRAVHRSEDPSDVLTVEDRALCRDIAATARYHTAPGAAPTTIRFRARGVDFVAELYGGPGGWFLSNEISYRAQRQLVASGSGATSFHVHTPGPATVDMTRLLAELRAIVREVIVRRGTR